MEKRNLSELFRHCRITRTPQIKIGVWGDRQYWCSGDTWTTNVDSTDIVVIGDDTIQASLDYLEETVGYCDLMCESANKDVCIVQWPNGVWVVLNPQTRLAHRVNFIGTHGEGHYFKDEGTTERELVIKRNPECWAHVKLRGQQLIDCEANLLDGTVFKTGLFDVPHTGNLKYQFEYEVEPFGG